MMPLYFCYDGSDTRIFTSDVEAKDWAQDAIDTYRDELDVSWDEAVEQVYWGEIREQSVRKKVRDATPKEKARYGWDSLIDYQLVEPN